MPHHILPPTVLSSLYPVKAKEGEEDSRDMFYDSARNGGYDSNSLTTVRRLLD